MSDSGASISAGMDVSTGCWGQAACPNNGGVRVEQAFDLWRMARGVLYRQELAWGKPPGEVSCAAPRRML